MQKIINTYSFSSRLPPKKRYFFCPSLFSSSTSLSFRVTAKYLGKNTISFCSSTMIECLQSSFFENLFFTIRNRSISWWPCASFVKPLYGFISLASCNFKRALIFSNFFNLSINNAERNCYRKMPYYGFYIFSHQSFRWIAFTCVSENKNACDWFITIYSN